MNQAKFFVSKMVLPDELRYRPGNRHNEQVNLLWKHLPFSCLKTWMGLSRRVKKNHGIAILTPRYGPKLPFALSSSSLTDAMATHGRLVSEEYYGTHEFYTCLRKE